MTRARRPWPSVGRRPPASRLGLGSRLHRVWFENRPCRSLPLAVEREWTCVDFPTCHHSPSGTTCSVFVCLLPSEERRLLRVTGRNHHYRDSAVCLLVPTALLTIL